MLIATVLLAGTAFSAWGCGDAARIHTPPAPSLESAEVGLASWYGHPYHGRLAANGEIYNMHRFTAAHRSLPFGTSVLVRNLKNGRSVVVRITDRGPFPRGRIIDLSRAAARAVGMLKTGLIRVRVEMLAVPAVALGSGCGAQGAVITTASKTVRLDGRLGLYNGGKARSLPGGSAVSLQSPCGLPARPKIAGALPPPARIREGDRRRERQTVVLDP
jgi:hypothetical protein